MPLAPSLPPFASGARIDLASRGLTVLPLEAFANPSATVLDASNNALLTALPQEVAACTSLRELYLNDCTNLTSLPRSLSACSELRVLDLRGCTALASLPRELGRLQWLGELTLDASNDRLIGATARKPRLAAAWRRGGGLGLVAYLRARDERAVRKAELTAYMASTIYPTLGASEPGHTFLRHLASALFRAFPDAHVQAALRRLALELLPGLDRLPPTHLMTGLEARPCHSNAGLTPDSVFGTSSGGAGGGAAPSSAAGAGAQPGPSALDATRASAAGGITAFGAAAAALSVTGGTAFDGLPSLRPGDAMLPLSYPVRNVCVAVARAVRAAWVALQTEVARKEALTEVEVAARVVWEGPVPQLAENGLLTTASAAAAATKQPPASLDLAWFAAAMRAVAAATPDVAQIRFIADNALEVLGPFHPRSAAGKAVFGVTAGGSAARGGATALAAAGGGAPGAGDIATRLALVQQRVAAARGAAMEVLLGVLSRLYAGEGNGGGAEAAGAGATMTTTTTTGGASRRVVAAAESIAKALGQDPVLIRGFAGDATEVCPPRLTDWDTERVLKAFVVLQSDKGVPLPKGVMRAAKVPLPGAAAAPAKAAPASAAVTYPGGLAGESLASALVNRGARLTAAAAAAASVTGKTGREAAAAAARAPGGPGALGGTRVNALALAADGTVKGEVGKQVPGPQQYVPPRVHSMFTR